MALKILFRRNKTDDKPFEDIVGQTTAEGRELDQTLRTLAGNPSIKKADGSFVGQEYHVEAIEKTVIQAALDDSMSSESI